MSALNIPITLDLKSGAINPTNVSNEIIALKECSLAFRDLLSSIPSSMTTTATQLQGVPGGPVQLTAIVIIDTPTAISMIPPTTAALVPAAASFNVNISNPTTGTLYIYINPNMNTVVGPASTPDTVAGKIIHELGHFTPNAMVSNPVQREQATLDAENPVRESFGLPPRAMSDLQADHRVPGSTDFLYKAPSDNTPTISADPIKFQDTTGHPFDGSTLDIDLLKAGILDGSMPVLADYVDTAGTDRFTAPFDPSPNKIVLSVDQTGHTVSTVSNDQITRITQFENSGSRIDSAFDAFNQQPWSKHITEYAANGHIISNVFDYETADIWSGSHSLAGAHLSQLNEGALNVLQAEIERFAFHGTAVDEAAPNLLSYESVFNSQPFYDFSAGNFNIDDGVSTASVELTGGSASYDLSGLDYWNNVGIGYDTYVYDAHQHRARDKRQRQ